MNGMYNDHDGLCIWAYTGDRTQWEVSLLKAVLVARSFGSWI